MHRFTEGFDRLTQAYVQLLRVAFALSPSVGIGYLLFFQDPDRHYASLAFHELAIAVAIVASLFITVVTWRCYQASGEPLLRWLTLAFLGFSVIYAPHGLFTSHAAHHPILFLIYGPVSRIVMNAFLLVGILSFGEAAHAPAERRSRRFWLGWLAAFLVLDLILGVFAVSPAAQALALRLGLEWSAFGLAVGGLFLMWRRSAGLPLFAIYALSLAMFAQSSLSFILSSAWNHQWWLAHAISAAGFLLLSYGVLRAYQTTRSFSTVYSQEVIMRQLESANEQLTLLATTDVLTSTANRRHFLERAASELARCRRNATAVSLIVIDLDHFKRINDTWGHQAGDAVLGFVARQIDGMLRGSDLLGRLGGEEFAVLLPGTQRQDAIVTARRICEHVGNEALIYGDVSIRVTLSLGVAEFPANGDTLDAIYGEADRQLYAAKAAGRNRVMPVG